MVRKVERTVEALGILCLASLLPMGILLLLHTSDGQKAVLENYVSMPFWLSVALLCLLCAAWSYVRYKNEHEDKEMAEKDHKRVCVLLIAAAVSLVVFLALKFMFPVT